MKAPTGNALVCRDFGHAWSPYTVDKVGVQYLVRLQCARCKTIRSRLMDSTGNLLRGNVYKYPVGYLMPGAALHTKEGRRQIREWHLKSLLNKKIPTSQIKEAS